MQVIVDRFEGGFAVVELPDRTVVNIPVCLIPDAVEGSVIRIDIDIVATEDRKTRINKLADKLWKN